MRIKLFISLFFILPLLRGGILEQKETEITEAIHKLEKGEITSEGIEQIIILIDELEKLAQEDSISSDDEEDDEDDDLDDFQDLKWFLEDLLNFIKSPSEATDTLDEWGEELPGCYDIIERAKEQIRARN